jgi:hypothetical protein
MKHRRKIFTQRPADGRTGIGERPERVLDVDVLEVMLVRFDAPGALVRLADGRVAIAGSVVAAGAAHDLAAYARRRAKRSVMRADRAWFTKCADALTAADTTLPSSGPAPEAS